MPDRLDDPAEFAAFFDAVGWGSLSAGNPRRLPAPFQSGVDIESYQLDLLARAIEMARVSLLIADDVGLGKTIEAGLIVKELLLRYRARRVLVVTPADLTLQWRDEMRDKFGLEFRIIDSALIKSLRSEQGLHANPWSHFPRLITSIAFLNQERVMRRFRETLPGPGDPRLTALAAGAEKPVTSPIQADIHRGHRRRLRACSFVDEPANAGSERPRRPNPAMPRLAPARRRWRGCRRRTRAHRAGRNGAECATPGVYPSENVGMRSTRRTRGPRFGRWRCAACA